MTSTSARCSACAHVHVRAPAGDPLPTRALVGARSVCAHQPLPPLPPPPPRLQALHVSLCSLQQTPARQRQPLVRWALLNDSYAVCLYLYDHLMKSVVTAQWITILNSRSARERVDGRGASSPHAALTLFRAVCAPLEAAAGARARALAAGGRGLRESCAREQLRARVRA